jgi:tetratricopeptide (TPR) repeat protein
MRISAALFALMLAPAALAAPRPVDRLFADLQKADSREAAAPLEVQILQTFRQSGSPSIDLLLVRADTVVQAGDKDAAAKLAAAVTKLAPNFAEGWHLRAGVQAASGDDKAAMISLQKTVALNPRQFAALAELGSMLEEYGDKDGALKLYRRALALDPQYEGLARKVESLSRKVEGQGI